MARKVKAFTNGRNRMANKKRLRSKRSENINKSRRIVSGVGGLPAVFYAGL